MKKGPIVAIDGPAGSGKSTVAGLIAQRLGLIYLDTGAMYRAATLACIRKKVNFLNPDKMLQAVSSSQIDVRYNAGKFKIYLDGEEVSQEIRSPLVNRHISRVSELLPVRELLVQRQREIGSKGGVIEGRDIGTVVFPDADFKFFLDASFEIRVERRYREMREKGISISREEVAEDLRRRDRSDLEREYGPLRKAEDAIYIDTSHLSIEEVTGKILEQIQRF